MPAPRPLTLCPAAILDWSRPDTPAATEFGDIYFSTDGGLEETRAVFLDGCGLPEGWRDTQRFVIGELGFGSGLNFLAAWQLWEKTKPINGQLHFVSIEKYPLDKEQLSKALSAWLELKPYSQPLIKQWPGRVRGFHRLHFGDVTLTLIHDDIAPALNDLKMKADAWFLDGFSPSKNPDMWAPNIMTSIANLSAQGARLATFTVAGAVRRALTEAGFTVERKEGFGRKRHRLEAKLSGSRQNFRYDNILAPTIIGTGIGGLSLAKAFLRRGIKPTLVTDSDHIAASGNPAALIKPRLDLQDRPESRFFLGSYFYALNNYTDVSLGQSIIQIPKSKSDVTRHTKILSQAPLPAAQLCAGQDEALVFPQALIIDPIKYRDETLRGLSVKTMSLSEIPLSTAPLFVAAGYGIRTLLPDWPMRFSRGQICWGRPARPLQQTVSYGGYAVPLTEAHLLGATHDRIEKGEDPFALRPCNDEKNREEAKTYLNVDFTSTSKPSRASIRVTSKDTLPVIGKAENGAVVMTGLGSRGFVFAPLLAEALVSEFFGDPMPVSTSLWEKLSVSRLLK